MQFPPCVWCSACKHVHLLHMQQYIYAPASGRQHILHACICSRFSKPALHMAAAATSGMLRLTTVTHRGRTAYRMSAASYSVTSMCCLPPCMPFCLHILHWHRLHVHYTSDLEKNRHDRYTLLWLWSIGRSMVHEPQTTRCQTAGLHCPGRSIYAFTSSSSWLHDVSNRPLFDTICQSHS